MFEVYAHLRTKCEILTRNSAEILENASLLPFISMLIGEKVVAITVFLKTTTISAQSSLHKVVKLVQIFSLKALTREWYVLFGGQIRWRL